jgi:hypothetical protein
MQETKDTHVKLGASGSFLFAPFFIALALLGSTAIAGYAFYRVRLLDDSLAVTGSAKQEVVSDTVKWRANFSRTITLSNIKSGYATMAADEALVKAFMEKNGVNKDEVTIAAISMNEDYSYNSNNNPNYEKRYTLSQQVTVDSKDVDKITNLSKQTQTLVNQGVIFTTYGLEYYYSKLSDLRVSLLSDAIKDAKARADKIAEASGKTVGQLKNASSGVVQVLPLNSVDVSDYGAYATGDIKKEVMVTVKAAFTLR